MKKLFVMVALLSLLVSGCGGGGDGSSGSEDSTATGGEKIAFSRSSAVDISVGFPEEGVSLSRAKDQDLGLAAEVEKVILDVKEGETYYLREQVLTRSGNTWSGTLSNLPVGPTLTFIARAYDSSGNKILQGSTDQVLTGEHDLINISLSPVYDGAFLLPKISQIQINPSARLEVSQTAKILISVGGNFEETVSYRLSGSKNSGSENREGGTLTPCSGTITLEENTGTIEIDYRAPERPGTYRYTIAVTNEQNNTVETDFEITVDSTAAAEPGEGSPDSSNPKINVRFAPVITSLKARQSGSTIIWTAIVDKGTGKCSADSCTVSNCMANGCPANSCTADNCTADNCTVSNCTVSSCTADNCTVTNCAVTNCTTDTCANGGLKYHWSFDGGLEFKDCSTNPAIMVNYDPSIQGILTLTVQGCGGSTTISYNLQSGQFPAPSGNGSGDDTQDAPSEQAPPTKIVLQADLSEVQDKWISNQYDNNEATVSKLKVGKSGENQSRALIRFNLDGLPEKVSSAIVYLYCFHTTNPTGNGNINVVNGNVNGISNGIVNVDGNGNGSRKCPASNGSGNEKNLTSLTSMYVDMVTSIWDENTGWSTKPSFMKVGTIPAPVAHSWVAVDITPLYLKWKMGAYPNYGIQLRLNENGNGVNEFYSSSFMENTSLRPKLVVTP